MVTTATAPIQRDQARRGFWLRQLHRWHWISSAVSLAGLLLFAVTGFTLNHAGAIEARPVVTHVEKPVPPDVLAALENGMASRAPLPPPLRAWLRAELGFDVGAREAEWDADEVYLSLPRPGGDAWLSIDRVGGSLEYERTDRGWIALANDLHKGRGTGASWSWFIDVFALACLVFSITGLWLLKLHATARPATWPLVGFGVLLPLLLFLLFVH